MSKIKKIDKWFNNLSMRGRIVVTIVFFALLIPIINSSIGLIKYIGYHFEAGKYGVTVGMLSILKSEAYQRNMSLDYYMAEKEKAKNLGFDKFEHYLDAQKLGDLTAKQYNEFLEIKFRTADWLKPFFEFINRSKNAGPLDKKPIHDEYRVFNKSLDRRVSSIYAVIEKIEPQPLTGWPLIRFKKYKITNGKDFETTDQILFADYLSLKNYRFVDGGGPISGHYIPLIDDEINPQLRPGGILFNKLKGLRPGDEVIISGVMSNTLFNYIDDGRALDGFELKFFEFNLYLLDISPVAEFIKKNFPENSKKSQITNNEIKSIEADSNITKQTECIGSYEKAKCESLYRRLAAETEEDKQKRRINLNAERDAAMREVISSSQ